MEDIDDDSDITEDFIDMKTNCGIQMGFFDGGLERFWASQLETYPVLAEKVFAVLVPFATTLLCKTTCSCLLYIESKTRNRWILNTTCE